MLNSQPLEHLLGTITLVEKGDVSAGSIGTWILIYTVGSYGLDSGGQIKIAFPPQGLVGEPVEVFVKGEDCWRNPRPVPENVQLAWLGSGEAMIGEGQLIVSDMGQGYLIASAGDFTCRSNPII